MQNRFKSLACLFLLSVFLFSSCNEPKKKHPEVVNEEALPAKVDSLSQQPQDATQVTADTISD